MTAVRWFTLALYLFTVVRSTGTVAGSLGWALALGWLLLCVLLARPVVVLLGRYPTPLSLPRRPGLGRLSLLIVCSFPVPVVPAAALLIFTTSALTVLVFSDDIDRWRKKLSRRVQRWRQGFRWTRPVMGGA
ncbi:hypothetical protein [Deinococcus multiflagellatus]|uniref:hypothetical protein n=1 Tax=Deinococcus multiflagellatus TaxID=1656887 RepID=UPI001CCEFABF|nr:hypothetical protein [Deinococcus multiflagellatus]MBZ9715304.1 hypothetical protein [Deinococcus multiflagellatus]